MHFHAEVRYVEREAGPGASTVLVWIAAGGVGGGLWFGSSDCLVCGQRLIWQLSDPDRGLRSPGAKGHSEAEGVLLGGSAWKQRASPFHSE